MNKLKVFIGSSVNGLVYAQGLASILNQTAYFDAEDWVTFFDRKEADVNITTLFDALNEFDIALFFVSGDFAIANINFNRAGKKVVGSAGDVFGAKPNVWFEHGLFTGRLGIQKSQIILEEMDAKTRPLMLLSDYYGVNPYTYKLDQNSKDEILKFAQEKQKERNLLHFKDLSPSLKRKINYSFKILSKKLENHLSRFKAAPLYYTVQAFKTREECYEIGEKIIAEAEGRLFTTLAYEGELKHRLRGHYPKGLWTAIKKKIDTLKASNSIQPGESKNIFKRYLNLANQYIYAQAEEILTGYSDYIEIRDTYCHFIEVVITDDKVLLVLPDSDYMEAKVDTGVLIHSQEVAEEFKDWFLKLVPEPNHLKIDSVKNLKKYKDFLWDKTFMRNPAMRCPACTIGVKLPKQISDRLKKQGLLTS